MTKRKFLFPFIILIIIFIVSISFTVMLIFRNIALEGAFKRNEYAFISGKYIYETSIFNQNETIHYIYEYDAALRVLEVKETIKKIENQVEYVITQIFFVHIQTNDFTASYSESTNIDNDHLNNINIKSNINRKKGIYTANESFNMFIDESIEHYEGIIKSSYLPAFIYQL